MGLWDNFCNTFRGRPLERDVERARERRDEERRQNERAYQSTTSSYANTESYHQRMAEAARKAYRDAQERNSARERELQKKLDEQKAANRKIIAKLEEEGRATVAKLAGEKKEEKEKIRRDYEEQIQSAKQCHAKEIRDAEKEIEIEKQEFKKEQMKLENEIEVLQQNRMANSKAYYQKSVTLMEEDDEKFQIEQSNGHLEVMKVQEEHHALKLEENQIEMQKQQFIVDSVINEMLQGNKRKMLQLVLDTDDSKREYQTCLDAVREYQNDPESLKEAVSDLATKQAIMNQHLQNLRQKNNTSFDLPPAFSEAVDCFLDQMNEVESRGNMLCGEMNRAILFGKTEKIADLVKKVDELYAIVEDSRNSSSAIEN